MLGNVWEWTSDWYGAYQGGLAVDPQGPPNGSGRVLRGGSWGSGSWSARASLRVSSLPEGRYSGSGFRCGGEKLVP